MYSYDAAKKPFKPIIKRPKDDSPFNKSRRIQAEYERSLRGVAREVTKLIRGYDPKDILSVERLKKALYAYAEIIEPWGRKTIGKLLQDVANQDARAWQKHTQQMSMALRKEVQNTPLGDVFKRLADENVNLIKSIPIEAAQRVHSLVNENLFQSARAEEIATKIMETERITHNRAILIARTEISRASSVLTETRAKKIGSSGYIWRTSGDLIVRESHRKMNGVFVKWDEPPILDRMRGHAGCLPNCRCWPLPIFPEG